MNVEGMHGAVFFDLMQKGKRAEEMPGRVEREDFDWYCSIADRHDQ
jgi:hypothetical protein